MRILLLRPSTAGYATPPPDTPSGLMYLAATSRWVGHDVEIRDLDHEELGDISRFDAIGITILSKARQNAFGLIRKIREQRPQVRIIAGGPHVSSKPYLTLRALPIDCVVSGEGEEAFLAALEAPWPEHVESTGPLDIDAIPFPAYDLVDLDRYYMQIARNNPDWIIDGLRIGDLKYAPMIASRGCVGRCIYCNAWKNWGLKIRRRSAKNVVDEMEMLNTKYGVSLISFNDNCFPSTRTQGMEICAEIQRRGLKMLWKCDTRADIIDETLAIEMRKAGCFMVAVGLESASPTILKNINKKLDLDKARKSMQAIKDAGLLSYALLMVGNPGESEQTIRETAAFVSSVKPHLVSWVCGVMILPSTQMETIGNITDDFWSNGDDLPYYLEERTMDELTAYAQILQDEIEKDPIPEKLVGRRT